LRFERVNLRRYDTLMETTFVNSMDAPSLAVVLPIIMRGLREPSFPIKKKAAVTCGNICALVDDVRDLNPFIPVLQPELEKCEEHSHPDLRECAAKAKESLLHGLEKGAGERKMAAMCVATALVAHGANKLDKEVSGYAASLGGWVIEMAPLRIPPAILANDVKMELLALLEGQISDEDLIASAESAVLDYKGLDAGALLDNEQRDYIVDLQGIILAFAGRVLLQRTNFSLERGKTYGIVGQNGTGKTTLLNRIAAKDVAGFPQDVSVYYILHEILSEKEETIVDFMVQMVPEGVSRETVVNTLMEVGFDDVKMAATIQSLSGGWRMKLAIARAMLWDADVLLLDEPTNHLDTGAIAWLVSYLKSLTKTTICLVSHDYDFLAEVLTDVIHLHDKNLTYYPMGFRDFQSLKPEIVAALPSPDNAINKVASVGNLSHAESSGSLAHSASMVSLAGVDEDAVVAEAPKTAISNFGKEGATDHIKPIRFPDPGNLEGVKSRAKCIMYMKDVSFTYPGTSKQILTAANVKITQDSRAALIGLNGAGKTTLMKLLIGELSPDEGVGEVWQHHNLRLAYIAQHSMHHLEESIENTPLEYLQNRFYLGRDKEISKRSSHNLSKEEMVASRERGAISEIIGRQERGKSLFYECVRAGRKEGDTDWEVVSSLEKKDVYVMKMVRNFDEKLKAMHSGMDLRPLTKEEVRKHLEQFGIDEDLAMGKIKRMSGGQKSRLVLAAAMWINPHIIALDEPTNYLDNDTLAALTKALSDFKGGVLTISHNKAFVNELCHETWNVGEGIVVAKAIEGKEKKMSVAERRLLKQGGETSDFSLNEAKNNSKMTAAERKAAKVAEKAAKGPIRAGK
jgi:elongation factor 3